MGRVAKVHAARFITAKDDNEQKTLAWGSSPTTRVCYT
jgi:hypothetical protein